MRDPMHKTQCDTCYRGTWYETVGQECRNGYGPCGGHLKTIDRSNLAPRFASYYESGVRIRVRFSYGEERTGTVAKTTGWKPSYMLMARSNSWGSSDLLDSHDAITAVKIGRTYRATGA